ncbi:MAG TPA: OmpA family protein [Phycisphaerae bacterium]|nr:OmpA family protein [Phycisphaerae bacterium]
MTRMTHRVITPVSLLALGLTLSATGCGPNAKDQKIQDLTAENQQLKNELADRERQFNDAVVRENEARSTIDELNREMAKLRSGDQVAGKSTDGWITMPSFDMISVPGEVLFPSGRSELTPKGRSTLSKIASDIRSNYPDRDIYVFGHTDNEPIRKSKWKDNWELGAARSLTVIRTMRDMGIANESLVQANCSQYRPKSGNVSPSGKSQNRRVEFYAVRRDGGVQNNAAAQGRDFE